MGALLTSLTPDLCSRRYPEFKFKVSSLWVRQFKWLLGYEDSRVHDDEVVPDVFFACLRSADFRIFELLEIDLDQLLHTTQKFEFMQSVKVGDEITSKPSITKVRPKLNSSHPFVSLEISTEYFRGEVLVAKTSGTIFVQEAVL